IVGFEDSPLQGELERLLNQHHQPLHVQVNPGRIAAHRARAVHAQSASGKRTQTVDAEGIEYALNGCVNIDHEVLNPVKLVVRRRAMNADREISVGVGADHMPAWRYGADYVAPELQRIVDHRPRKIERGKFRVEAVAPDLDRSDLHRFLA